MNQFGKAYAGVGARKTPTEICEQMTIMAAALEDFGLVLRSGGAEGADMAFERGVKDPANKEIYLPWPGFNAHSEEGVVWASEQRVLEARKIAAKAHPLWDRLSGTQQHFHIRNVFQVLGRDLNDPVSCVICWTEGGKHGGGTGQAIRIAQAYSVPIFDMGSVSMLEVQDSLNTLFS
jgi:hypothetical protein